MPCDWEGIIGLASHWQYITDLRSVSIYKLYNLLREKCIPPMLLIGCGLLYF